MGGGGPWPPGIDVGGCMGGRPPGIDDGGCMGGGAPPGPPPIIGGCWGGPKIVGFFKVLNATKKITLNELQASEKQTKDMQIINT